MEAKAGMKKSRARVGRHAAKFLAHPQGEDPFLFPHEMMEPKLQDFRAVLVALVDGVKFGERLARHAQLCVAAGGLQLPFKLHGFLFSKWLATRGGGSTCSRGPEGRLYNRSCSNSVSRRLKSASVLSIGAAVVMSTPAKPRVSSGNFEPPDFRKMR
jgi:hypothetical protein